MHFPTFSTLRVSPAVIFICICIPTDDHPVPNHHYHGHLDHVALARAWDGILRDYITQLR